MQFEFVHPLVTHLKSYTYVKAELTMKKILSFVLAVCTVLALFVFPVSAATVSTTATGVIAPPSTADLTAYVTASGTKTVVDVYNNCYFLNVSGTTGKEWNDYRSLLVSKGYTEIVGKTAVLNSINKWALYANDEYMVNCFYDAMRKEAKISIEPRDVDLGVFTKPSTIQQVCEPMLIQMGLDDNTSTDQRDTERSGMGYILRLADGRFIVYDGGHEGTKLQNADKLYNIMKKYAPTSGAYANRVVIAAWVITHPHSDHIGAFLNFTKYYIGYEGAPATLQTVICNMPSVADYQGDTNAILGFGVDVDDSKVNQYNKALLALEEMGVDVYKAHLGQKYYFNEAAIEILYTAEVHLPEQITVAGEGLVHGTNTLSIVSRVTWDCPAYTYSALFTADANHYVIRELNKLYDVNLSTPNFVQLPHHGSIAEFGEGTPIEVLTKFYEYVGAYRSLMPAGVRYGYVNLKKTKTPIYEDEARLIGYAQRAGNPTPGLKNILIAGSSVTTFTLKYSTKKVVVEEFAGADFYATEPTLASTTVPYKDGNVYLIYNEAGLADLSASRTYRMLKDMTITVIPGETTYPLLREDFYGNFDGNGYSLVVRSESAISLSFAAGNTKRGLLFNTIGATFPDADGVLADDQGTVKNLNIYVPSITLKGSTGGQFGVIAGITEGYSVIKNVTLNTGKIMKSSSANANVGSMIGKVLNGVYIVNSAFVGRIANGRTDSVAYTAGGLIGCVEMVVDDETTTNDDTLKREVIIQDTTVNAGYASGYLKAYTTTGGFIGAINKNPATVSVYGASSVNGRVIATTTAGGVVGSINTEAVVRVYDFTNNAAVTAYHVGGVVGKSEVAGVNLKAITCTNTGTIKSTGGVASTNTAGTAGGILGYGANEMTVYAKSFTNSGTITVEVADTARIGSLFGRLGTTSGAAPTVTVNGATNSGTVSSNALYAGIWAGHISGASKTATYFNNCVNTNTTTAALNPVGIGNATSIS